MPKNTSSSKHKRKNVTNDLQQQEQKDGKTQDDLALEDAIELLKHLLSMGQKFKVIQILRDLKTNIEYNDITYLLSQLLPFGDIIFYKFVKTESREILNSLHSFDNMLHFKTSKEIIEMLHHDIIEPEYAAELNRCTLYNVLYYIVQFSEYDEGVIQYLFDKYSSRGVFSYEGLVNHMLFKNVVNDVMVYLNTCITSGNLNGNTLSFTNILESYQRLVEKYEKENEHTPARDGYDKKFLRSRFIGVCSLIVSLCVEHSIMLPTFIEFEAIFKSYYSVNNIKDTKYQKEIIQLLDKLIYDCYMYVDTQLPWGLQNSMLPS
jgi:hypothetical protein